MSLDDMDVAAERFKVIIIGDSAVGKSSVAARQCNKEFDGNLNPTIGSAHLLTKIQLGDRTVTLVIWDTAGQEEFAPLVPMYARKANCALIVASAVSPESVENLKKWEDMLYQSGEKPPVIAVINKMDLAADEQSTIDEITIQIQNEFSEFYFVSAKTGLGIEELFLEVARKCIATNDEEVEPAATLQQAQKKKECC